MATQKKRTGRGSNPASWNLSEKNRNTDGQPKKETPLLAKGGVRVRMPDEASKEALLGLLKKMGGSQAEALGLLLAEATAARQQQ